MKLQAAIVLLTTLSGLWAAESAPKRMISLSVFADREHAWTDNATVMPDHLPGSPGTFFPVQGSSPWMFVVVVNSDGNGKSYECPRSHRCELNSIEVTKDYFGVLVINHRIGSVLNLMSLFEKRFHLVNAGIFRSVNTAIQVEKAQLIQKQLSSVAQKYGLYMPDIIRAGALVQSMAPLQELRDMPSKFGILKMEECLPTRPCLPKGGYAAFAFAEIELSRCEDVIAKLRVSVVASNGPSITMQAQTDRAACDSIDFVWSFGDGTTLWTKESSVEHRFKAADSYRVLVGARCSRKREASCLLSVASVGVAPK